MDRHPSAHVAPPIGAIILPGRVPDPRPGVEQAVIAESIGLGAVWLAERQGTKHFAAIAGAAAQATSHVRIGCGATNFQVRHPMQLASLAMTLQALSAGRFLLTVGRGLPYFCRLMGTPDSTAEYMRDHAMIFRRLCAGQKVSYRGPAGNYPDLRLIDIPEVSPPPIMLAAIGPRSLDLAGRFFDGVLLHTMLTADAVRRSTEIVRNAAADAGRDPACVRVHASVIVAPDLPEDEEDAIVRGRAITYFQIPRYGELLVQANQWDSGILEQIRTHPQLSSLGSEIADQMFLRSELIEPGRLLPTEWLTQGAAVGSASHCASRLTEYLQAGADELVINGTPPQLLGTTTEAFKQKIAEDCTIQHRTPMREPTCVNTDA
jgi:5,10-methylenetetrahydromethanopterin reductase